MEEDILKMYFKEKMKQIDIAKKLNISKYKVSRVISKNAESSKEKEKRKIENKKKNIEFTKNYIKQKRSESKNNDYAIMKNLHDQASMELSAPRKLSNMAYRNWNKSAYKYNQEKSRFEFRKGLGRSYDIPKYIRVQL